MAEFELYAREAPPYGIFSELSLFRLPKTLQDRADTPRVAHGHSWSHLVRSAIKVVKANVLNYTGRRI